jgi:hypothetical protein
VSAILGAEGAGTLTMKAIAGLIELMLTPGGQAVADRFLISRGVTPAEITKQRADTASIPDPPEPAPEEPWEGEKK